MKILEVPGTRGWTLGGLTHDNRNRFATAVQVMRVKIKLKDERRRPDYTCTSRSKMLRQLIKTLQREMTERETKKRTMWGEQTGDTERRAAGQRRARTFTPADGKQVGNVPDGCSPGSWCDEKDELIKVQTPWRRGAVGEGFHKGTHQSPDRWARPQGGGK